MTSCCIACGEAFVDDGQLEIHLATEHVFYSPYECENCKNARFPSDYALRLHMEEDHQQSSYTVKYRVTPELERKRLELKALLEKCLAARGGTCGATHEMKHETPTCDQQQSLPVVFGISSAVGRDAHSHHLMGTKEDTGAMSQADEIIASLLGSTSEFKSGGKRARTDDSYDRTNPVIACPACSRTLSSYKNSLILHVSTHHCDKPIYECRACPKKWYSLSARTKEHVERVHGEDVKVIKDNREEMMPILKANAARLFPIHFKG